MSKTINLFGNSKIVPNTGIKYSTLLEEFLAPFASEFEDIEYYEDIFEFAINAWNFGNMQANLPKGESDKVIEALDNQNHEINVDLLKRMIDYKISHFKAYTNFIVDYKLKETDQNPILSVITQEKEQFLESTLENMREEIEQEELEENYINRTAIIVKPLQPFVDWYAALYPDELEDLDEIKETKTYLISESIEDVEAWLKKKFKKIFELELQDWHNNKKEWPQKRTYKMFNQWFQVDVSTMVYDLEKQPVHKFG